MENKYKIYLRIAGKTIKLPVLPQEYSIKYPTSHSTYDVLGIGEVIIPRSPGLMEISLESYFPMYKSSDGNYPPEYYIKVLESARDSKLIIDVIINRFDGSGLAMYDTNISAVVSDFEATEKGGEAGDIYYKLKLTEYRSHGPVIIQQPAKQSGARTQASAGQRQIPSGTLYVGAKVIANGKYFYDSFGAKPTGTANNLSTIVTRIIPDAARPYPVLIGGNRGWIKKEQLQVIQ